MRSEKPQGRPFQDWVTRDVLPTIRKTGSYVMGEASIGTIATLHATRGHPKDAPCHPGMAVGASTNAVESVGACMGFLARSAVVGRTAGAGRGLSLICLRGWLWRSRRDHGESRGGRQGS